MIRPAAPDAGLRCISMLFMLVVLVISGILLAGCATLSPLAPIASVTPQQHVAELQQVIIKSGGHASPEILGSYGRALLAVDDFQDASTVLDEAIDPANPNSQFLNWRGVARAELGNIVGARADFEQSGSTAAVANLAKLGPTIKAAAIMPLRPAIRHRPGRHSVQKNAPLSLVPKAAPVIFLERPLGP